IKLKAARDHIECLETCTSPLDTNYYAISLMETLVPVLLFNPPNSYRLIYTPKEPNPESLANIIGDALGNPHSALDYAVVPINARIGTNTVNNCAVGGDAAHLINLIGSATPIQFNSRCNTVVNLKFGAGTSVPNEPVISTLQRAADAVERTLNEIDKLANP